MADPFSMTNSIFDVMGAVGKIGKGINILLALKHAPEELAWLMNEVMYSTYME